MHPTQHSSNNDVLHPPAGATNEQCEPLPITRLVYEPSEGRPVYMSCWGKVHPPIAIGVDGDGILA